MPSRANNIEFGIYAIAEVESHWNWGSVYYVDPITIGIMQCYAYNAARLLKECRESDPGWATFAASAPRIANALDSYSDNDWTEVYLTQDEGNAWVEMSKSQENHAIQMADARNEMNGYFEKLVNKYGLSDSRPQTLIFAACMYHQSPKRCIQVINACGPSATLEYMYQCCLNNNVLGRYKTRYKTVHDRLKAWDGESAPPDFGQNGDVSYSGEVEGVAAGGSDATISVSRISFSQGRMIVYGTGYEEGIQCRETTPGNWIPQRANITAGAEVAPDEQKYTGGGSGDAAAICALYDSWEKNYDFAYSQGAGRLSLPSSGASDCSGSIWCAYHQAAGIDPGTYTGAMISKGRKIANGKSGEFTDAILAQMQPGDLIIYARSGTVGPGNTSHVEMYMGTGWTNNLLGGGSAPVPHYKDAKTYTNGSYFKSWEVRRYL